MLKTIFYTLKTTFASFFFFLVLFFSAGNSVSAQEVTGLEGWSIFLDPGHSQTENQGLYGYSEAEKVLRIGLALRDMLLTQTDIDTVYMSRTTDTDYIELGQRSELANELGADFLYSIHSDAGSSTANSTLFLYGGWLDSNDNIVEKDPPGGREMGDFLEENLSGAMRIPTRGNRADRVFYSEIGLTNSPYTSWPYLSVNRNSNMPSILSEGGFHTNPTQQQRNLNAEWKRLEAQAAFWSILEYMGVERPPVGIATGYITDAESGRLLNGITVSIAGQSYTTDTYESLFKNYSNDPDALRNGFYYIEELSNETHQLIAGGSGYYSDTLDVNVLSDDFTFTDIGLVSSVPPHVVSTSPVEGDTTLNAGDPIIITFSRPMDQASVENAFTANGFEPKFYWTSETQMRVRTDSLNFETNYSIEIDSTAMDASEFAHNFDADGDSVSGGVFVLNFKTGPEDFTAPQVVDVYPANIRKSEVWPIISVTFDEALDEESISSSSIILKQSAYTVPGELVHNKVNEQSILHFFPAEQLTPNRNYTITISGELGDSLGNTIGSNISRTFPTGGVAVTEQIVIDDFDAGVNNWWTPEQSGSTSAYLPEHTTRESEASLVNKLTNSSLSMRVNYGWDTDDSGHLIREYTPRTSPKFDDQYTIQSYVFGDGSGNQMRFVVRDANGELEASDWVTVDWFGWQVISWALAEDNVNAWANGDGTINGQVYMDSFQLTYVEGQPNIGFIVFDDLRAVKFGEATSSEEIAGADLPKSISLDQNYPNPFNPSTNIRFGVPERSQVNLEVYDLLGRKVKTLFNGVKTAGFHTITFDASDLSSGVYLYRLTTGRETISKKMLLMK